MNKTGNIQIYLRKHQVSPQSKSGCLLDDCELATKLQTCGSLGEKRNEKNTKDAGACLKHSPMHSSNTTNFEYCTLCTTWLS